ncbi:hypothetical protein V8E54_006143 [Elaphomyces granulatus]
MSTNSSRTYLIQQSNVSLRNLFQYSRYISKSTANNPSVALGGLVLNKGVTNKIFYAMLEVLLVVPNKNSGCIMTLDDDQPFFSLKDSAGNVIPRDDSPLNPGDYFIIAKGPFAISNEQTSRRMFSVGTGRRTHSFRDAVRQRDRTIYSVQNGLLLRSDVHQLFDSYGFSVNPDDGHKVVFFTNDSSKDRSGKYIERSLLDGHPDRPPDQLLRWHFRQAVLTHMRGAGELVMEFDFPPGTDVVETILNGPNASERMEFELYGRLGAQLELFPEKKAKENKVQ